MFNTPEEMQEAIDKYFADCDRVTYLTDGTGEIAHSDKGNPIVLKGPTPYTITGLTLALGFTSRFSLYDYCDRNNENDVEKQQKFAHIITRARQKCENYAETRLFDRDGSNGAKFWLASNGKGWSDKQDIGLNATINVKLVDDPDDSDDD